MFQICYKNNNNIKKRTRVPSGLYVLSLFKTSDESIKEYICKYMFVCI